MYLDIKSCSMLTNNAECFRVHYGEGRTVVLHQVQSWLSNYEVRLESATFRHDRLELASILSVASIMRAFSICANTECLQSFILHRNNPLAYTVYCQSSACAKLMPRQTTAHGKEKWLRQQDMVKRNGLYFQLFLKALNVLFREIRMQSRKKNFSAKLLIKDHQQLQRNNKLFKSSTNLVHDKMFCT